MSSDAAPLSGAAGSSSTTRDDAYSAERLQETGPHGLQLEGRGQSRVEAMAALDLKVARRMFYGGFALLPWLWFVAWAHFRHVAKSPHADPRLATYVHRCLVGSVVGGVILASWVLFVSLSWQTWGEFGRGLMLVLPEETEL